MLHNTRTVYSTESLRDAHTLRDLLAVEGVSAVVFRDPFEGGATGGVAGVTIQVGAADEAVARRVVGRFEQRRLRAAGEGSVLDAWPRCPECDAPRMTCCPVCQTAGHHFPAADHELAIPPEPGDAQEPLACGCGGCAAGESGDTSPHAETGSDAVHGHPLHPEALPLLTCTTCDEPFVPRYLQRCEWCGHAFADGIEFELPDDPNEPVEPLNARVVFVFFALAAGALAILAWLAHVL